MKQRILSALVLAMVMISSTFAANINNEVNQKVLTTFSKRFGTAKDVKWVTTENYIKASFSWDKQSLFAYYTEDGEFIGVSRNMLTSQLPLTLQTQLQKKLTASWITELYEFASDSGTSYYVTVQNADEQVILKSSGGSAWSVYKKTKL